MPFENPTGLSNFIEVLLDPADPGGADGDVRAHGRQPPAGLGALRGDAGDVRRRRRGRLRGRAARLAAPQHAGRRIDGAGGNLEGKEQRFGIANSRAVGRGHDRRLERLGELRARGLTGIGGAVPLANMATGEVIFGGVGSGLYGMLLFVLLAVFIAGLMVGRTPEYLGKKIEAREMKLVVIGTLVVPLVVLVATALAIATKYGAPSIFNSGPAGLLRDAVRLHVAGQQQRLGVRRLHRLRAAERAGQRAARSASRSPT